MTRRSPSVCFAAGNNRLRLAAASILQTNFYFIFLETTHNQLIIFFTGIYIRGPSVIICERSEDIGLLLLNSP